MAYETRIVFFADILGFRDLISSESAETIQDVLETIRSFYEDEVDNRYVESKEITFFSDSIVISFRVDDQDEIRPNEFLVTIADFQLVIAELVAKGIFLRGGVSLGDCYHSNNLIFGPAFIEAYDYETKKAIYPRVACAPSIFPDKEITEEFLSKSEDYALLLTLDVDGIAFVDYFGKVAPNLDHPEKYVERLRESADLKLREAIKKGDTAVAAKFVWVLDKFKADFR